MEHGVISQLVSRGSGLATPPDLLLRQRAAQEERALESRRVQLRKRDVEVGSQRVVICQDNRCLLAIAPLHSRLTSGGSGDGDGRHPQREDEGEMSVHAEHHVRARA